MSERKIFRQKSIDRVSSPDQLDDYIRVTNPGVWMILISIILVMAGSIVWGTFGKLETRLKVPAVAGKGNVVLYVKGEDILDIKPGQKVEIDGSEGSIISYLDDAIKAEDVLGDVTLSVAGYAHEDMVYPVYADIDIKNGVHNEAEIVTDSVSPITFLINNRK